MERTAGTVSRFARHGQAQGVSYRLGAVERDALDAALELTVVLHRQHDVREAEAARLVDAQVGLAHGADLARQSDFAEDDRLRAQQAVRKARGHGDTYAEVGRRLVDADAAGHLT